MKYLLFLLLFVAACKSGDDTTAATDDVARSLDFDTFGDYWYQGTAELNAYDLEQYRYGEKRKAEAVLIFVTEDFSKEKQVKLDEPQQNQRDAQKVLKLNLTKKFVTGIYPYSMMLSVFTPIYDSIPSVKVTASSQEWCGHTFTQLNREGGRYKAQLFSYFEKESDQHLTLDGMPEDNLWTLLRLNPNQVPTGDLILIPGLLDQRFTHEQLAAEDATISIKDAPTGIAGYSAKGLKMLHVNYKKYPRELRIFYTVGFPFEIAGWEEIKRLENGKEEVSRATRKAKIMTDYWTKNKTEFEPMRRQLKLKTE